MPLPWQADFTPEREDQLLDRIVGFRIVSKEICGAWKLHQHHPPERRRKIAAALRERGSEDEIALADLMERTIP